MKTPDQIMTVNRRQFVKTTALTAVAYGILSQGIALAQDSTPSGYYTEIKVDSVTYRLKCTDDPKTIFGSTTNGGIPTGTPKVTTLRDGKTAWVTSVTHDIGHYPLGYDANYYHLGASKVYLQITGTGPKKYETSGSFSFTGSVIGQHSINAHDYDGSPITTPDEAIQAMFPSAIKGEKVVKAHQREIDPRDINGESKIELGTQRIMLIVLNGKPMMRWTPNPTPILKAKVAPLKRTDIYSGPVYTSAVHDLAMIRGSVGVLTSTLSTTDSTAVSLNAKLTYSTPAKTGGGDVGIGVTNTVSHTLVAPSATTTVTDLLQWRITIEKSVNGGQWVDIGEIWETKPTWQDKSV